MGERTKTPRQQRWPKLAQTGPEVWAMCGVSLLAPAAPKKRKTMLRNTKWQDWQEGAVMMDSEIRYAHSNSLQYIYLVLISWAIDPIVHQSREIRSFALISTTAMLTTKCTKTIVTSTEDKAIRCVEFLTVEGIPRILACITVAP